MKAIIKILLVCIIPISAHSQNFQWADRIGGPYHDYAGTCIDPNNNVYISGSFVNSCFFQDDTLFSDGLNDLFLAKYDKNDNELWVKKIGGFNGLNFEYRGGFAVDMNNSSVYYSCSFYDGFFIDPQCVVSSFGEDDLLLAKIDSGGNCQWVKQVGSSSFDDAGPISIDNNGNVFWVGRLGNAGLFDNIYVSPGTFLAKISSDGNVIWCRHEITNGQASCIGFVQNDIYMSGITYEDTTMVDTISLISNNKLDCFLAKLDSNGSAIWAKRFGGKETDYPGLFIFDKNHYIYIVGIFHDSLYIDGDTLENNNKDDMFLAKFSSSGHLEWIQQSHANGAKGASCFSIEMNTDSTTFYIAGTFSGTAQFGGINANSTTEKDVFIAKYNLNGQCLGLNHFGEAEYGEVHLGSDGKLLISGMFSTELQIGSTILTSFGNTDIFLAKLDTLISIPEENQRRGNDLNIYANPTTGKCNITIPEEFLNEEELVLRIYDQMGKLVQEVKVENTEGTLRFDIRAQAKGLYHATLSNGRKVYSGKIVFE